MKNRDLLAWAIIFIVGLGGALYMYLESRPSKSEVAAAVRPLPPMGINKIDESTFAELTNRQANGSTPVSPSPANPPRNDPFSR